MRVAELGETPTTSSSVPKAQAIIRVLIDRAALRPAADGGIDALFYGELAGMVALADGGGGQQETRTGPGILDDGFGGCRGLQRRCFLFAVFGPTVGR